MCFNEDNTIATLCGVVSGGVGACREGNLMPSIYTRIAHYEYMDWIDEHTEIDGTYEIWYLH